MGGSALDPEVVFAVCNALILPGWIVLLFRPGWNFGRRILCPILIPGVLALAYAVLMGSQLWQGAADGGIESLQDISRLFDNNWILLAGWVHYLAFDLVVGSWLVHDSRLEKIPHPLLIPCLVLTCLVGPFGFLCYVLLRAGLRRKLGVGPVEAEEDAALPI